MKKITLTILASFLLFSCSEFTSEKFNFFKNKDEKIEILEEFVRGSEDIPLLNKMEQTSDEEIGFDSSSGSILSSSYESEISNQEVKNFYIKTLPQMGWTIAKDLKDKVIFKRDNESLEIEFSEDNGKNIVTFFISSAL